MDAYWSHITLVTYYKLGSGKDIVQGHVLEFYRGKMVI